MHRNETSVEKHASIPSCRVVRASIAPLSVTLHTNSMSIATPSRRTARRCSKTSSISATTHRNETSVEKHASIPSCRVVQASIAPLSVTLHTNSMSVATPSRRTARRCRAASSISATMHRNETSVEKHASIPSCRVVQASIAPLSVTYACPSQPRPGARLGVVVQRLPSLRQCTATKQVSKNTHRLLLTGSFRPRLPRCLFRMSVATPSRRTARRCGAASSISATMHRNETSVEKHASTPSYRVVQASIAPLSVTYACPRNPVPAHGSALSCSVFHLSDNAPQRNKCRKTRIDSFLQGRSGFDCPVVCYIPTACPPQPRPGARFGVVVQRLPSLRQCTATKQVSKNTHRLLLTGSFRPRLPRCLLHTHVLATPSRRTARRCRAAPSISPTMHRNEISVEKHASTPSYRVVQASIAPLSVTYACPRNPVPAHGSALSCSAFHLSDNAPQRNKCRKTRIDSFLQSRPDPHCCVVCYTPTACLRQPRPSARLGVVVQLLPTLRQEPTQGQVSRRDPPPRTAERVCGLAQSRCRRAAP